MQGTWTCVVDEVIIDRIFYMHGIIVQLTGPLFLSKLISAHSLLLYKPSRLFFPMKFANMLLVVHCNDCEFCLQHFLTKDGRWGRQDKARWDAFLGWLSDRKLLTTKVQSRTAVEGVTASLDELRQGDAGEIIPRDSLSSDNLFTNRFLQ